MGGELFIRKGREASLLRRHPWVFSGSVDHVSGDPQPGDTVDIRDSEGTWLARGAYSPLSQIRARVWTWREAEPVDRDFFRRRLADCLAYRRRLSMDDCSNAWRLVHGEADGLPGCVVDKYGPYFVCQFSTVGAERWKQDMAACLMELEGTRGVYERSDGDSRQREGLEPSCGVLAGEEIPERFEVQEHGLRLWADLKRGHKTGYYLDQRDNRALLWDCGGLEVLNCFSYSGGFGIRAALGGAAHVVQLDASADALELAKANASLNSLPDSMFDYVRDDVFHWLRQCRDSRRSFDVIVLDPPKFADTQRQLEKACRGYKDINLLAAKLLRPGGRLLTFSCSGAMTPELFAKVVGEAFQDAGRLARVMGVLSQAPDHPLAVNFPEGHYLTGLDLAIREDSF